ncbi:MAG: nuclear transport factor 2 family protein [Nocardioides sp.]
MRQQLVAGIMTAAIGLGVSASATAQAVDHRVRPNGASRCSTAAEDRNLAAFRDYLDALLSGDGENALSFWRDDAVVEVHGSVPYAGVYEVQDGSYPETQLAYWQVPGPPEEEPALWADCDQVILRGPFERTAVATGKEIETTVIEYFTFDRAGAIARDDFYFTDTALVNEVLGPQ